MKLNTLFMGTADFTLPILKCISQNVNLIGIFTGPDQFKGRNRKSKQYPKIKSFAIQENIPYFQNNPSFSLKKEEELLESEKNILSFLSKNSVDLIFVAAYGHMLDSFFLQIPKYYALNLHFSLLPKYRGASPIQSSLLNQEESTGISIQIMNSKLDQGDIIFQKKVSILNTDDYIHLRDRLCQLTIDLLPMIFERIQQNSIKKIKQKDKEATYCYKIKKEHGKINWNIHTEKILAQIKAYSEWPKSFFFHENQRILVFKAKKIDNPLFYKYAPGTLLKFNFEGIHIKTKDSILSILELQIEGKKNYFLKILLMDILGFLYLPLSTRNF